MEILIWIVFVLSLVNLLFFVILANLFLKLAEYAKKTQSQLDEIPKKSLVDLNG